MSLQTKVFHSFTLSYPSPEILQIALSRPKANAMNMLFFQELLDVMNLASKDLEVRVVVICSKFSKFFTAGLDLQEVSIDFGGEGDKDVARQALEFLSSGPVGMMQASMSSLELCRKPVIAAVNGYCIGAGIDLISAADIRLCSADSLFSVREVVVGLAADLGTLQRLPKIVGNQGWVKDVCLTGRDFTAEEALSQGLVSKVFDSHEKVIAAALDLAKLIASKSPVAVLGTKHLLNHARDHSVREGLEYTQLWNSVMLNTSDVVESATAIFSKATPKFAKL